MQDIRYWFCTDEEEQNGPCVHYTKPVWLKWTFQLFKNFPKDSEHLYCGVIWKPYVTADISKIIITEMCKLQDLGNKIIQIYKIRIHFF
jgi:hypothetical protein